MVIRLGDRQADVFRIRGSIEGILVMQVILYSLYDSLNNTLLISIWKACSNSVKTGCLLNKKSVTFLQFHRQLSRTFTCLNDMSYLSSGRAETRRQEEEESGESRGPSPGKTGRGNGCEESRRGYSSPTKGRKSRCTGRGEGEYNSL